MTIIFEMAIKKVVKFFRLFHFTKVLTKPSLEGSVNKRTSHEILVLIAYASSEGPDESTFLFSLVRPFAVRIIKVATKIKAGSKLTFQDTPDSCVCTLKEYPLIQLCPVYIFKPKL